jgi:hypothetical protein
MRGVRYDQYESPGFRSILWWIVLGCTVVLTILLAIYFLANENYIYIPFPIVLCFGAIYLANKEWKAYRAAYQARRDEAAIKLFNAVRSGDQQKFAVFLRPFFTTDDLQQMITKMEWVQEPDPAAPPGTSKWRSTLQQRIHVYPLEDTIVEAFRDTMPVVALGKPGETFGVGRILVDDENWQSAASELMPSCLTANMFTFIAARIPMGIKPNHTDALSCQNSIYHASIKLEAAPRGLGSGRATTIR